MPSTFLCREATGHQFTLPILQRTACGCHLHGTDERDTFPPFCQAPPTAEVTPRLPGLSCNFYHQPGTQNAGDSSSAPCCPRGTLSRVRPSPDAQRWDPGQGGEQPRDLHRDRYRLEVSTSSISLRYLVTAPRLHCEDRKSSPDCAAETGSAGTGSSWMPAG